MEGADESTELWLNGRKVSVAVLTKNCLYYHSGFAIFDGKIFKDWVLIKTEQRPT